MSKSVTFSQNQYKVFKNSGLKIQQELVLQSLEKEFDEILTLLELFGSRNPYKT